VQQKFMSTLESALVLSSGDLPIRCGDCCQPFSVGYALQCKKGGHVILRHNKTRDDLASRAIILSEVRDETKICTSRAAETVTAEKQLKRTY